MNVLLQKAKAFSLIAACLLLALVLTSSVSAAETDRATNQAGSDFVPAVYTFEGDSLAKVLSDAANTMQACRCQNWVSYFVFERLSFAPARYRLSIYLSGDGSLDKIPEDWEIVSFKGYSLPGVLREVSKYVTNCACQSAVRNITYERATSQPGFRPAPLHVVSLILESPPPD